MATINKYKTKDGQQRYRVRWTDDLGRQKSKSFDRYNIARSYQNEIEHTMRVGEYVSPDSLTVKEFLDSWIETHKANLKPNTERGYRNDIKHICNHLGQVKIQSITPVMIEDMYAALQKDTKDKKGLSGTSALEVHRVLSKALQRAVKNRLIPYNPCTVVDAPKKNTSFKPKFVHPEDIDKYLNAFEGHYMYTAVCLAIFAGLRRGEALGLCWSDINKKNEIVSINKSLGYHGISTTKSGKEKTLPMFDTLATILAKQKEYQRINKELHWDKYIRSDYVVTKPGGGSLSVKCFSGLYKKRLEKSGLEFVRFHDLRHTFAALLIFAGVDLKTVSELMGHSSIKITMDVYGHLYDEHKKKQISKLNQFYKA